VDASSEAVGEMNSSRVEVNLEAIFYAQYERLARAIAGMIRDRSRAEELAVDVFLKWCKHPKAHGAQAEGWLYRTAIRTALNELRSETRRARYETLFGFFSLSRRTPTPEDFRSASETQQQVRLVLGAIGSRHAELLVLRNEGFTYDEVATTLGIHPTSIGALLGRAEQAFRKEYRGRYGEK
jgi:RNA polymerase sigma-70 factor (ECF subfamily)